MKIKLSKSQWEFIGKKAGWMKTAIIPDDGYADGGEPYTDEEMELMKKQDESKKDKISEIINSIREGRNEYYSYSHFSLDNMHDYTLMSSTINDLAAVYHIDEVQAADIVQALTHPGHFTEEEINQWKKEESEDDFE